MDYAEQEQAEKIQQLESEIQKYKKEETWRSVCVSFFGASVLSAALLSAIVPKENQNVFLNFFLPMAGGVAMTSYCYKDKKDILFPSKQ
ncbi:MAG: hypothetical protein ACRCXZ_05080 [Patescibacteria group bacterium]